MDGSANDWYQAGDAALRRRSMEEAREAFIRAVELNPRHANALYRLGEFAQASGDAGEAEAYFRQTLRVHPGHKGAQERLQRIVALSSAGDQPAYQPSGAGLVGTVRGLRQTALPTGSWEFRSRPKFDWSFRLDQRTSARSTQPLPVHLIGEYLTGDVRDGDWVELPSGWAVGRPAKRLTNLSTGEYVHVVGLPLATQLSRGVSVVLLSVIALFVAYGFYRAFV